MIENLITGFEYDAVDEAFRTELANSGDRSEVAGENGIYLDDELTSRRKSAGKLTVVWTFKGSVLMRHSSGAYLLAMTADVAAAGWKA